MFLRKRMNLAGCAIVSSVVGGVGAGAAEAAIDLYERGNDTVWVQSSVPEAQAPSALASNAGQIYDFFALTPSGVENRYYAGGWTSQSVSGDNTYTALAGDRVTADTLYASGSGGTDAIHYDGSAWVTASIGAVPYKAIGSTATAGAELIFAKADGSGTGYTWHAGGGTWGSASITATDYDAIATDGLRRYDFYGARPGGGLDHVYYSGVWNTSPINSNTYVALASDVSNSYNLFGARADGGIDHIFYSGGWITESISSDTYSSLAADGSAAFKFVAAVPEPAALSVLLLGALAFARRR